MLPQKITKNKLIESLPDDSWIRTCQECGHKQLDNKPKSEMTNAYANRKCEICKSESLDYGRENASFDWMD